MNIFLFLAEGFEEIEAIDTVNILRRGGLPVTTVSITGNRTVTGSHNIPVVADQLFETTDFVQADMLILPGGLRGVNNLNAHEGLKSLLLQHHAQGKQLAAICAAPSILGGLNLLQDKKATVYPGLESTLKGTQYQETAVVKDGNIITGRGPGLTFDFALAIVAELQGKAKADEVAADMLISFSL